MGLEPADPVWLPIDVVHVLCTVYSDTAAMQLLQMYLLFILYACYFCVQHLSYFYVALCLHLPNPGAASASRN